MNRVFADAFDFVALLNRADQFHQKAIAAANQLRSEILTSAWVLAEVADALAGSLALMEAVQRIGLSSQTHGL